MLKGAQKIEGRPGATLPSLDFDELKKNLTEKFGAGVTEEDVMSSALYPKVSFRLLFSFFLTYFFP